ncbi:MAG: hypothetical protein JW967_11230 [Dehalococcoidales bacterium]|nr:hypothetical protein [Dehalococcoidales bacterium]
MVDKTPLKSEPERLFASLSPETIDRLADLVVAKLKASSPRPLTSKQVTSQGPYPETELKLTMREMAREMAKRICIPSLGDKSLRPIHIRTLVVGLMEHYRISGRRAGHLNRLHLLSLPAHQG